MKRIALMIALLALPVWAPTQDEPQTRSEEPPRMAEPNVIQPEWTKIAENLQFPEGPAWDGKGTLYFSSCQGEFIGKVDPEGYSVFLAKDSQRDKWQRTNGLTVGSDGYLYAAEWAETGGGILRISPDGIVEKIVKDFNGKRFHRPNDVAFDPAGNLYFTDPNSYDTSKPDGTVYRRDGETGAVTIAAEGFCFSNGLTFTPDGKHMFLAESAKHRVLKFDVAADGTLTNQQVFAEMPGGDPDGMNLDDEGNLYVAHFGGGHIWVFAPDGALMHKIKTPGSKPSNVEFGGAGGKRLYVTEDETHSVYYTDAHGVHTGAQR